MEDEEDGVVLVVVVVGDLLFEPLAASSTSTLLPVIRELNTFK